MRRLLLRLLVNALGLYAAVQLVPGIRSEGSWVTFLLVAVILGAVNALIKPVLVLLSCPLIILTLGLFTLVINAAVLWLAGVIGAGFGLDFYINGFAAAFWGGVVVGLVNLGATLLLGDELRRRD